MARLTKINIFILVRRSLQQNFIYYMHGAYLGFCQGGCTFLSDLPPLPPDLDPDSHQDFELDPDPDPHQIRIKSMRIHSPGLNCQKIVV